MIKNRGGIALAFALKRNGAMEKLLLRDNRLKDEAGQEFADAAKINGNLMKIDL